ncbi:MAG TPA: transcription-repair coupling factor [Candidatus Limnocylindrales bacterium]|nr:transcription-repair coupling factor [Candidatus Limnocylindrales bacterium]
MSDRYRGRTTRQRNVAERVAREWAERRAAAEQAEQRVDLDRASAEAEVELLDPAARAPRDGADGGGDGAGATARPGGKAKRPARPVTAARTGDSAPRAGRRTPDLSALPPLLHETGSFASLRERLGTARVAPGMHGRHAGLTSVPHGAKSFLAASLALAPEAERICWIARDAEIGDRVADELAAWLGDPGLVAVLEPRTSLAYERSELVPDETAARVAALASWKAGRAKVLVASVQALLQATLGPDDLPAQLRTLKPGTRIGLDALLGELMERGYTPVLEVAGRGEFARRGGIVDVFPPSAPLPVRIEFFGDEIDSLRAFDPTDQRSVDTVKELTLLPATEFLLPEGGAAEIRARLGRLASKLPERLAIDLARFAGDPDPERPATTGAAVAGGRALAAGDAAEVWARLVAPSTGLDHLDAGTLLVLDEPGDLADAADFLWRQADERHHELVDQGELPRDWPTAYLPAIDWKRRLHGARTLELTWQSEAVEAEGMAHASKSLTSGDLFGWRDPVLPPGRTERLVDGVEHWLGERARVVLVSDQAPRLAELLGEAGHAVGIVSRVADAPPPGAIALVDRSLNGGFEGGPDGLAVVTDRELFGSVRVRRPKAMRRVVPRDILERLSPGDLVVHIDHGIARYEQMLRRGEPGQERDYLELSFAGTDRIFVPVEQINRVSRYSGGENPGLSKLGGTDWLRTKQRVRKAVSDLAEELLRLYAKREAAEGFPYQPDSPWQAEMEASFPYEETPDQLRAAIEVKADMEARRPMDRLVVGDVGYGKTEVALRAAFKAMQDGKQVAVLVPTTVLAGQHFKTFSQRFAAFPLNVRLLSRFVSAKEQEATVAGLANGSVDIVIGTHRLLSKDVAFRDLGLVVVDEEQRFGVAAKERLKQLRAAVDVLTLSATPIPRTLNLALAGIRDLSVIETPPEDRLPIQTRVAEASAGLVRDAILRELDRGGQVYYVHNRVETIEAQAEQLRRLLPGARILVGHGQMAEGALEKVMLTFADGAADVLVCTTIIESGLDIPNANTIVIDRADTLGLAQLYQLRGRVGRSSRRAYAYLLYRRRERMSEEARKRLQAIFNASELGAGFQIALADLEIRGAGNILGGEQSGFMASVGFDLYSRMLAEAVEEAKARREDREPVREVPQAVVDLPVEAHLPDMYVPDEAQKLELYRRLARARTLGDLAAFRQEVTDRYGPMPAPVLRLVEVAELRLRAETAGVASLAREEGWLVVRFGAALSRATAMQLLSPSGIGGPLPGIRPGDMTFASNQVRLRLPRDPLKGWTLTQAVVSRLVAAAGQSPE